MMWRTLGDVPIASFITELTKYRSPLLPEVTAIYAEVAGYSALYLATLFHESKYGTLGVAAQGTKNPTGLRPRPDGAHLGQKWIGGNYLKFRTWSEAAREWRQRILDPTYAYARTKTVEDFIHVFAPSSDGNNEAEYVGVILDMRQRFPRPEEAMTIVATPCPLEIAVIDWVQANRPALPMSSPSYVTIHEVGNTAPGADENMHRDFVRDGGGKDQVSFHFVVGPSKIIQLIYLNENAWHASDNYSGTGNRDSIAIETIQIGDFNRTLNHLAYLTAEIYRNPFRFKVRPDVRFTDDLDPTKVMERTRQHNFWALDKKNCPQFIRERGLWVPLLNAIQTELNAEQYAEPALPSWWNDDTINVGIDRTYKDQAWTYVRRQYTALKGASCKAYAGDSAPETRAPLKAGESFEGLYQMKDGKNRQWIISRYGSRIRASSLDPQVIVRSRA